MYIHDKDAKVPWEKKEKKNVDPIKTKIFSLMRHSRIMDVKNLDRELNSFLPGREFFLPGRKLS